MCVACRCSPVTKALRTDSVPRPADSSTLAGVPGRVTKHRVSCGWSTWGRDRTANHGLGRVSSPAPAPGLACTAPNAPVTTRTLPGRWLLHAGRGRAHARSPSPVSRTCLDHTTPCAPAHTAVAVRSARWPTSRHRSELRGRLSVHAPTLARRGPRPRSRAAASARECSRRSSGGGRVAVCRDGRWVAHGRRGALGPLPERLCLDGVHASMVSPLGEKSRSSEGQSCLPGPGAHPPPTPAPDCTRRPPLRQRLPSPDAASHGHSRGSRVLSARPLPPTTADDSVRPRSAETATERQAGLAGSETQTSSKAGGCACG